MVFRKERFSGNIMKAVDFLTLLIAFPVAYFIDEFIRIAAELSVKAYAIGPTFSGFLFFFSNYWLMGLGFALIWVGLFSINGLYRNLRRRSFRHMVWLIISSSFWATVASGSYLFFLKMDLASRLFFLTYTVSACVLIIVEKRIVLMLFEMAHRKGYNQENLLIVGTSKRAQNFIRTVKSHANWGLRVVGLIDDERGFYGKEIQGFKVLGRIQDIPFIVNRIVIDRVIFVVPRLWLHRIEEAILACEQVGIPTSLSLDLYNLHISHTRLTDFNGYPLLEFETFYAEPWQLFIKRVIDIILSAIALLLFSPLIILAAVLIKVTSKGPVLFKQVRSGLNGRKFTLYKFRSMIENAEEMKLQLLNENEMSGPVFKMKRDPRVTRVGHYLRKLSIDELPQLFNVLKGDMSIVGPRPPLVSEVEDYEIWQRRRLSLKPGIKCIWQVSGRHKVDFNRWMEMDLEYIDSWSLWLDLKIMFKTFFVVLVGYGAH